MYDESVRGAAPPPPTLPPAKNAMQMPVSSAPSVLHPGGRGTRPSNISVPPNSTSGGLLSPLYTASSTSSSRPHSHTPSISSTTSASASGAQTPLLLPKASPSSAKCSTMPSSTSSKPNPSLRLLLNQDKARTSFACVAFATLHIATASVDPETGAVRRVLGKKLTLAECRKELQPFMTD